MRHLGHLAAAVGCERERLHAHEVHDAGEIALLAQRHRFTRLRKRDVSDNYLTEDGTFRLPAPGLDFTAMDRLTMVACGTASYACLVAKYWFEQIAGLPVDVDVASEFRYREPPIPPRTTAPLGMDKASSALSTTMETLAFIPGISSP